MMAAIDFRPLGSTREDRADADVSAACSPRLRSGSGAARHATMRTLSGNAGWPRLSRASRWASSFVTAERGWPPCDVGWPTRTGEPTTCPEHRAAAPDSCGCDHDLWRAGARFHHGDSQSATCTLESAMGRSPDTPHLENDVARLIRHTTAGRHLTAASGEGCCTAGGTAKGPGCGCPTATIFWLCPLFGRGARAGPLNGRVRAETAGARQADTRPR